MRKSFKKTLILISISSLLAGNLVVGQEFPVSQRGASIYEVKGLQNRISLDLRLMDVLDVLKFISTKADVNIVTSKNVAGRVTLFISNVTLADALDIVLLTNNLAAEKRGDIIYVMAGADYEALYGEKYYDKRVVKTVRLKYAAPENIATILRELKSSIGKVLIDETTGTVVMIDTPEKIDRMLETIEKAEVPTVTRTYPTTRKSFELQYAKAETIAKVIENTITKNVGKVQYDTRTNRVIVTDLPQKMEEIENMVEVFDRKTRQVFIEAQILEINLSDQFQAGVNWQYFLNSVERPALIDFKGVFPLTLASYGQVTVGTIDKDEYTAAFQLLKTLGRVNVLSSPQIAIVDGEEATFLVGTKQAYVTSTTSQAQTTTTVSEEVTFIDVGVKLKVTPIINEDGFITMKLNPEVSTVSNTLTTPQGNQIPIVDTSTTSTTVLVKDGVTILLAGLIKDKETETIKKVPLLGSMPIIGGLFSSKDDKVEKKELIILITPHIISGEEMKDSYREERKPRLPFRR